MKRGDTVFWKRGSRYYAAKFLCAYPDWRAVRVRMWGRERVLADNEIVPQAERDKVMAERVKEQFRERWKDLLESITANPTMTCQKLSELRYYTAGWLPAGAIWHVRKKAERLGLLPLNHSESGPKQDA